VNGSQVMLCTPWFIDLDLCVTCALVSDRGSNVSFSDIYVFNDSTYGAVGSLWRGDANNISMSNVTMDGDLTSALFDFSSYAESNSYPLAANSSLNSRFMNVKHNGTIPNIIALPIIYYI
jgi:hypothetical protein